MNRFSSSVPMNHKTYNFMWKMAHVDFEKNGFCLFEYLSMGIGKLLIYYIRFCHICALESINDFSTATTSGQEIRPFFLHIK